MDDIEQRFQRITGFIEARLTPLFDPANGSDHGFGMDDTSRALRALRYTVQAASAVNGLVEKRETAPELRQVVDQAMERSASQLCSSACSTTWRSSGAVSRFSTRPVTCEAACTV